VNFILLCYEISYEPSSRGSVWSVGADCSVLTNYIYIYIYGLKVAKTVIQYCTNDTNAYTEYTNIINRVVNENTC
jgi:hypothetical protein